MSDNEQSGGKAGAWTEEAKVSDDFSLTLSLMFCNSAPGEGGLAMLTLAKQCQFLLHIIAQLKGDGKAISWSKINMPGRTTKSLQNMWTKINKTIAEMEAAASEGANTTSAKATRKSPSPPEKWEDRRKTDR